MKVSVPYLLKPLLILLIVFALCWSCSTEKQENKASGIQIALKLPPKEGNPRNSEGDFVRLKDGRILLVYTHFTGGGSDHATAHLESRYSDDDGKTWSESDELVVPNKDAMNIMSVSLIRLKNGKIALYYLQKTSDSDCIQCIPYMRVSEDEALSWGSPQRCIQDSGYFVMNNDRVVQLENGRLLLPVSLHACKPGGIESMGKIMCYYSDDGITWTRSAEAANPEGVIEQEPGVVALKDGRLMLFCRTDGGVQYISYSKDHGETWSPLKPGNISSPVSPASIERIPSTGDLLLVWNDHTNVKEENKGKRTPFNVAISKDDGKTWIKKKVIENDPLGWYCYTAILFTDDHVLLSHCSDDLRQTKHLQTTQITRLSLDWIYEE